MPNANPLIRAGIRSFTVDGVRYGVVGNLEYNFGLPILEPLEGADAFHGFAERANAPSFEVEIRDSEDLDQKALLTKRNVECQAELSNGKVLVLAGASQVGKGETGTEDGAIPTLWMGSSMEEV